jgi:ribose 5-phosphate isomerase A
VEVVQLGWKNVLRRLQALGPARLRLDAAGEAFVTDEGNYILDCDLPPETLADATQLAGELRSWAGVVDHGLFLTEATRLIVGRGDGVEEIPIAQ